MKKKIGLLLALALVCYSTSYIFGFSIGGAFKDAGKAIGGAAKKAGKGIVKVGGKLVDCAQAGAFYTAYGAAKTAEEAAKLPVRLAEGALVTAEGGLKATELTAKGAARAAEESKKAYNLVAKAGKLAAKIANKALGGIPVKLKDVYTKVMWTPGMKITSETLVFAIKFNAFGKDVTINTKKIMGFKKHPEKFAEEIGKQLLKKIT